jgi:hypothetical protein
MEIVMKVEVMEHELISDEPVFSYVMKALDDKNNFDQVDFFES